MTDQPTDFGNNYAARFLSGHAIFPPDERIYHRAGYQYDDVAALGSACLENGALVVELTLRSGQPGRLRLIPYQAGILRIQFGAPDASFAETSPMLVQAAVISGETPDEALALDFTETSSQITCTFGDYTIELDRQPFCLRILSVKGEVIFESETEKMVDLYTAPPLGLRFGPDEAGRISAALPILETPQPAAFLAWRSRNEDRYFGLGEKFTRFEKTGTRTTIWSADTCGSNTTDLSYKAVPVLFSTAGWALMLHTTYRSFWDIGALSYATGALLVEDSQLDLFLILAPTLKEQVQAYTALTGRPSLPPRWALGVWMSRAAYTSREKMLEVAQRLRQEEIPSDVFSIDPTWMTGHNHYKQIGVCTCNFDWDSGHWGESEALFREFSHLGYAICLWIDPYLSEDSPAYAEAKKKGYLVQTTEGSIARLEFNLAAGIVDFTNPQAKAWYQAKLVDLLQKGAAVFKVDFGDRIPADALFYNRKTGREIHNLYPHLYAQAVYEAVTEVRGAGFIWRRPGYIGTQRYPGSWAGDTQVSWEGMAGALRGGLSAAFTGESFWGTDIGGFVGNPPSEELYIRWAQFGLLSPLARFHGATPREPWQFGEKAVDVVRRYARLRYALIPYLLAYTQESIETGLPLMRPMILEFPAEPRIDVIDDQYMLGSDLLVAPVFKAGTRARVVYLPRGVWWPFFKGSPAEKASGPLPGGGFREVDAPLEHLPIFVRAGAVIPHYRQPLQHLKDATPRQWQLDIYPNETPQAVSRRHLVIPETGFTVTIDYRFEHGAGHLEISPAPITVAVRLVDRRLSFLRAANGIPLQPGDNTITFTVDAAQGVNVEFRV